MSDPMRSESGVRIGVPERTPTNERTNGRTNEESLSPTRDNPDCSVTRAPAYGDVSLAEFEARAILATLAPDRKAKAHQRAALRELAMTHCPGCSIKMPRLQNHSTSLRLFCGQDCPGRSEVDDVVVSRLLAGTPVTSNKSERLDAVRILTARGWSASFIASHMHTAVRSVVRYRAELTTRKAAA